MDIYYLVTTTRYIVHVAIVICVGHKLQTKYPAGYLEIHYYYTLVSHTCITHTQLILKNVERPKKA